MNIRSSVPFGKHTLLDVPTEVHDFAADRGVEDVRDLLLGAVVPRHDDYELGGGSGSSGTNYGVYLANGQITAGGSGTVAVQGTGGVGTSGHHNGVVINGLPTVIPWPRTPAHRADG